MGEAYPINCLYKDYLLCFITCTFYVISTMFFLHFFTSVLDNIRYQIYSGRERYTCSQICAQNQVNHFRENPISQWWLNTLSVFSVFIFSVLYVPLVWDDKWLLAIFVLLILNEYLYMYIIIVYLVNSAILCFVGVNIFLRCFSLAGMKTVESKYTYCLEWSYLTLS